VSPTNADPLVTPLVTVPTAGDTTLHSTPEETPVIPQHTPLYAVETDDNSATLHLVIGWVYNPAMPVVVTLASTKPGPHPADGEPLGHGPVNYHDDRAEARGAYEDAARTAEGLA
jgi:hypothetical protein